MEVETLSWAEYHQLLLYNNITNEQANQFEYSQPFERNRVSLFIAYSILILVGLAGNAWVACVITCVLRSARACKSWPAIQIYILALCCCDLVVLGFLVFLLLDLAYGRWIVQSNLVCQLYLSSEALNKFCGPFILASMSGYCYYRVCWPEKAGMTGRARNSGNRFGHWSVSSLPVGLIGKEIRYTVAAVLACVTSVLVLMVPVYLYGGINYLIVHNKSVVRTVLPKCSTQLPENIFTLFAMYTFVLGYLLPALLFTCFYSAILYTVRRRRLNRTGDTSLHFWRVAKTCMALVVFYLSCWSPYWAMSLYHYLKPLTDSTVSQHQGGILLSYIIHMLPYINCTGYPILYTLSNQNIKTAYMEVKEDKRRRDRERKIRKLEQCQRQLIISRGIDGPSSSGRHVASSGESAPTTITQLDCGQGNAYRNQFLQNTVHTEGETVL